MLSVGLTGGIGSGKSTVAERFRQLGAVVIDADQLARDVVGAGSAGLSAVVTRFGGEVLAADRSLDRAALGQIVFADEQARKDLEAITHPLIGQRTRTLLDAAAPEAVVVQDVPLIVEKDLGAGYHLTVVVGADQEVRVARLVNGGRGLSEADARSRIATQASDGARRAAADAWLDNNGTMDQLLAQVDALWRDRVVGFNDNLMAGACADGAVTPTLVPYDDSWPVDAARLIARITLALRGAGLGDGDFSVEHIGSTSVPGLLAKDVIDLQVGVRRLSEADAPELVKALADKGFPRSEGNVQDTVHPWAPEQSSWLKRFHGSADPGRLAHLHIRECGSAGWESALLFRDWLVANPTERDAYAELKQAVAIAETTSSAYTLAKEPWIAAAMERAREWARHTAWSGA